MCKKSSFWHWLILKRTEFSCKGLFKQFRVREPSLSEIWAGPFLLAVIVVGGMSGKQANTWKKLKV